MSVEIVRTGWLPLFEQSRSPNPYLTRHFTIKPGGIYNGNKIAIDVQRSGEEVAVAVKRCTGPNLNDIDIFTTKEFEPPSYGEAFPCDVCDLINRMEGVNPFTDAYNGYVGSLMSKLNRGFQLIGDKISRSVELQASQILQTGTVTLVNSAGDTVYEVDFKPKATHFPTAAVPWSTVATADPMGDLASLAKVIRSDGKIDSTKLIMGDVSASNFLKNEDVRASLDNRRMEVGMIAPRFADSGATFVGDIWVGNYRFEIWTYPDTFTDPVSGDPVTYINPDSVVMLSDKTRLDMTSARVPLPLGPDPRVSALMPGRMTSRKGGFDVTPNMYPSQNGKEIFGELESRTLLVPVQIDGFGCLKTEA